MTISRRFASRPAAAALSVLLSCITIPVAASTITLSNATLTTFDALSGSITFDWDRNSVYEITGTEVTVTTNDITTPGPQVAGTLYEFVIPNFYDPLPMKTVEITLQGGNNTARGLALPSVLDVLGADSDFINGGPALPVPGLFVSGTTSPTLVTEYWEMFPNPDFEVVTLYVPVDFGLTGISIATQSTVPIPASVWLFGSGMLGLIGLARRKRAN